MAHMSLSSKLNMIVLTFVSLVEDGTVIFTKVGLLSGFDLQQQGLDSNLKVFLGKTGVTQKPGKV